MTNSSSRDLRGEQIDVPYLTSGRLQKLVFSSVPCRSYNLDATGASDAMSQSELLGAWQSGGTQTDWCHRPQRFFVKKTSVVRSCLYFFKRYFLTARFYFSGRVTIIANKTIDCKLTSVYPMSTLHSPPMTSPGWAELLLVILYRLKEKWWWMNPNSIALFQVMMLKQYQENKIQENGTDRWNRARGIFLTQTIGNRVL